MNGKYSQLIEVGIWQCQDFCVSSTSSLAEVIIDTVESNLRLKGRVFSVFFCIYFSALCQIGLMKQF